MTIPHSTPATPTRSRATARGARVLLLLSLALGVVAFALVLDVTDPPGPGLDPDAMAYLGAAVSLARYGRYDVPAGDWASADTTAPLTHFPPGFPTAIAIPVRLGMPAEQGARLVVALSAFATVAIVVWLVGAAAGLWAGALAGVLLAVTPALVDAHVSVLSEPLFLACLTGTLALMVRPAADGDAERGAGGVGATLALGSVAAVAALVRYAGIAVPAAAALWVLLDTAGPWRTRIRRARVRRALLTMLPTVILAGAWGARNAALAAASPAADSGGPRPPYLTGFADDLWMGAHTVRDWLAPGVAPAAPAWAQAVATLGALVLVALLIVAAVRGADGGVATAVTSSTASAPPRRRGARRLLAAAGLLLLAYVGEVIASRLFVYGTIPFDERILAPVILLVEIAAATALGTWWWRGSRGATTVATRAIAVAAIAAWVAGAVTVTSNNLAWVTENGSDFAGMQWRQSPLIDYVRRRAAGRALYANWPQAIYFHTGRAARDLPQTLDVATLQTFAGRLAVHHGLVVAFDAPSPDVASPDSIARRLGLRRVARFPDGSVWELASAPPRPPLSGAPAPTRR